MDPKDKEMESIMRIFKDVYLHSNSWDRVDIDDDFSAIAEDWSDDDVEEEENDYDDWEDPNDEDPEEFEAIAIRLMDILTENKLDSYAILKDPIIAEWWGMIVKERAKKAKKLRKIEEAQRQQEEDERARQSLLARLTPEERRLLGIK